MIWKVLGIEKTKDEEIIKAAYREKLRLVNPEDDEEGFKELRSAYEEALEYVRGGETDEGLETQNRMDDKKKTEVDFWIDKVEQVYTNLKTRIDESKWEQLLNDPICDDLDTELEAAEKLLVFFMSHSYMPQNIWQLVDRRFRYTENMTQLVEKFPENYLDYIKWQIESPGFLNFDLFDGDLSKQGDEYINKLYEMKAVFENGDLAKVSQLLKELKRFDVTHPYTNVEEARYLLERAKEDDALNYRQQALSIMEELDFEYSDNQYIERIYAQALVENQQVEKAKKIYDDLYEQHPENYLALLGQARCIYLMGDAESAKEKVEDILEERVQDVESIELLDSINEYLVKTYQDELEQDFNEETVYKLGWCYYQQKEFEKGISLLDRVKDTDSYDYVNLRCRLFLANENYELAYPLTKKWLAMIEESADDGSREMMKRKNRLSLAHFSVGVCIWEVDYRQAKEESEERSKAFEQGVYYIEKAVEEEKNLLVSLSYKEQLARFFADACEYEKCIDVCNEIIESDGGFFPAYVHRQKANYELKNAKEVIDDYFVCQELYPVYIQPYLLAAEVFYAFEQYDDVEKVIESAQNAGLESDTLKLYEIRCIHYKEFNAENVEKALSGIKILKGKLDTGKEDTDLEDYAELVRELAILYWDQDNIAMTLTVIEEYLRENPDNTTILHLKVDVLNRENRLEEALDICHKLVKLEPEDLYTKLKLGLSYERIGENDKAIEVYQEILEINSEYAQAVRRLMYVYSFLSNYERDLDKCRTAISFATRFIELTGASEGYVERGNLYIDLYELEKSVKDCKKAIELDGQAYYAYNNLGCALLKLRRIDEAIEPLEYVIEMDPDRDVLPYLNLAECYVLKGDVEKGIDLYETIIQKWPERYLLWEDVAKLHRKLGQFDEAIACYQRIPETYRKRNNDKGKESANLYMSNLIECYCDMADTYAQMNDHKRAQKCFKRVMLLLGKYKGDTIPGKVEMIMEYYRDQGDYKQAEKMGKKLLAMAKKRSYSDRQLIFSYTTILFELGKKEEAAKYAKYYLKERYKQAGGEIDITKDRRYIPMHSYNIAIMYICMGNLDKACKYLGNIPDCKLCVMCETSGCFEYYFGMGLIAKLEGRKEEAKLLFEKAIELKGYYPCAMNQLRQL